MDQDVLVLNSDFEPLNVCHARRALVLVFLGKAEVLHARDWTLGTVHGTYPSPSVVKLRHHVKRPLPELRLSRRTVFARDLFTCQYCGLTTRDLTIDHVVPRRLGGGNSWDNVVAACRKCNTRKSDKPLDQSGMKLRQRPVRPRYIPYISLTKYLAGRRNEIWRDYLPECQDFPD
ncbi:MAG: HNH endonuclease [Chthonomonadales bacterium]|nr:HNH endonuclease [Chthonomonadales bacterium]